MEAQINSLEKITSLSDDRIKWLMQMLAIKKDAGMTRIYSAISSAKPESQTNGLTETDPHESLDF